MLSNYILILCCCVFSVFSQLPFFEKGQRAELFELLDNEIPAMNVYMPEEEFANLKYSAIENKINVSNVLNKMPIVIEKYLNELQTINFVKIFPGYNFSENIPQLQVGEEGYAKIDIEKIITEFDYNVEHYDSNTDLVMILFLKHFLDTNENFNLLEITNKLNEIKMDQTENETEIFELFNVVDKCYYILLYGFDDEEEFSVSNSMPELSNRIWEFLNTLKQINFNELNLTFEYNDVLPELQIGKDGYPLFDVEHVFSEFDFNPEHYEDMDINDLYSMEMKVFESNEKFNILKLLDIFYNLLYEKKIDSTIIEKIYPSENIDEKFYINNENDFKTKDATMTFDLHGIKKSFNKVTFSFSGSFSRTFSKRNFNLKIKGGDDLYGRSHFKLRADAFDPTYLRSKLVSDIHNRLGLKSISAGYIHLYINDEFMGLYILTDSIKPAWIEKVYGEKKTTALYKCDFYNVFSLDYSEWCSNENDNVLDHSEWIDFLTSVEIANSVSDIENIFEIDHFLYEMAIEYLVYGTDHYYHNFNFYRQPNGKWIYLTFDFDLDFGYSKKNAHNISIYEYFGNDDGKRKLFDILILKDPSKFLEILKEIVDKVFNPSILYLRIDELKEFIKSSVAQSKIPDVNGNYPGVININAADYYSMNYSLEEWDVYSEFTSSSMFYGLKYWILMKYRYLCQTYQWECDPIYMDENYKYYINEELNYSYEEEHCTTMNYENSTDYPTEYFTESSIEYPTESLNENLNEYSTQYQTEHYTSTIYYEKETLYEVDEPTFSTDNESSFDEEDTTESVTESSMEHPTESVTESSMEHPTESVTESLNEYSTQYQTKHSNSTLYYEKETLYEVDEQTFSTDDESSSDEEDTTEEFDKLTNSVSKITITKTKIMTVKPTTV